MPITSAARRASLLSSIVQQPRAPERYDAGLRERARWMPVTSWPASTARAAATAEATPPDMAATILIGCSPLRGLGGARPLDGGADRLDQRVDVGGGAGVPQREAQRAARHLVVVAHAEQYVRGLRDAGRAGRARRALDAPGVEQHQQRVALAAGEAEVTVAGQPPVDVAVHDGVRHDLADPGHQVVAQPGQPRGVVGLLLDRELDGGREAGDRRGVEGAAADVPLLAAAVHQRGHLHLAAYDESADAVGPA